MWTRHSHEAIEGAAVVGRQRQPLFRLLRSTRVAAVLVEATAIVEGTVSDLPTQGGPAPAWAWLNKLAHADWGQLADLAETPARRNGRWAAASAFLAGELRSYAQTAEGLLRLQRRDLIPLELRLLDGRTPRPVTPLELVVLVRAEMDNVGRLDGRCERRER